MNELQQIQSYFQRTARQFDRLYQPQTRLSWLFNRWVRRPVYRRFQLTIDACGDVHGQQILDVGCGSGRYAVALATGGAQVVGLDFAGNMLLLAEALAQEQGVASRCRFLNADFLEHDFDQTFHISLAIGFFDYIAGPFPFLEKLYRLTTEKVILTFPRPGGWRARQRRLRYRLKGCPLYFHSQASMAADFAAIGYQSWHFQGSWAVAFPRVPQADLQTVTEEYDE